ncbi:M23 family metallopeptidase [Tenacibaculum piscium]|uniref:M23 family metallopeptidase n=1 Tax=Tenacibaculum piscium TaxID=1458515 RepID=UPI001EFA2F47|nr:M23 family metallopeptidase [Tenacibaculum piscium]MCG8184291.1 M23 family metallopeptidase [Tenacibaculum piscium]MCG8205541.1 M23 family metallopeptidase [Tenacibaculum piscium]
MKFYFSIILCLFFYVGNAQKQYPTDYFSAPLKIPIILSGTFGELRSNHFHSGVDIKTQGKQGIPIYAPANGYVSRLKVSQYGFGKAIYLNHPNGYTTVYAHLKKFETAIEKYVKNIQYRKKNYQTGNIFTKKDLFPIKKGQLIGYTGDTGGSGGPHLHYEIRDTETEHIINPLLFGINPSDNKAPTIQKIMAYPLNGQSRINNSSLKSIISFKKTAPDTYISERITASGVIGFGVSVFDRLNDAINKNGIYSLEMTVNGTRIYYHDVETFSFAETKYINLLIDYPHYKTYKNRLQKTHKVSANRLNLYEDLVNNGKITIENGSNYQVEIIAKDIKNNTATIKIPIKGVASNLVFKQKDTTNFKIIAKDFQKFNLKNVTVAFPKNTFYNDCFIDFSVDNGVAKIHHKTMPIDKRYTLTFDTSFLSDLQKQQVYIANVSNPKYTRYTRTKKKLNKVYTSTKTLGNYQLLYDTKKPIIKLTNFKNGQWVSKNKTLKVKIKDYQSGIKEYTATIDGAWILMEYNHKKGILTYNFKDKKLVGSKHLFKIIVADNVGNTQTLSAVFYKK